MSSWSPATLKALHHASLKDRVVIITGGGRGFGWLIAEELLKAGAKVCLTAARHPEELSEVRAKADTIAGPGRCVTVHADVTKWEDCVATVDATLQAFGKVDVLINNAGRGTSEYRMPVVGQPGERPTVTKFYEVSPEAFRTIIETNVIGVFQMTKAAMPHFLKQKFGKIFSISTSLTTMSSPGLSPYGASKAGLEMTHRIWSQELKGTGVDINILLPGGAADTPFITNAMVPGKVGERAKPGGLLPGDVIVPPAVWLCADPTNGMTGERIIAKFWAEGVAPEDAMKKCVQVHNELPGIM